MNGTITTCPFLEEVSMVYCKAYPIKKMIPVNAIKDNPCVTSSHFQCPVYEERSKDSITFHILSIGSDQCPFLEVSQMVYCKVYPIKKMIPVSTMQLESRCSQGAHKSCHAYRDMAEGDKTVMVRGFRMKSDLSYHQGHTWLRMGKGTITLGLDDFASRLLGRIDGIEPPAMGEQVRKSDTLVKMACGRCTAEPVSPVSGTVMEINERLMRHPNRIRKDPYGQGWLLTVAPSGVDEKILSGTKARDWLQGEVERFHSYLENEMGLTLTDGGEMINDLHEKLSREEWDRMIRAFLRPKGGV